MPKNLDNLTPIEALYRARSYLYDYSNFLRENHGVSDVSKCVAQSAEQMEMIAQVFEEMQRRFGQLPPIPKPISVQ